MLERRRRTASVPTRKTKATIHAEKLVDSIRKQQREFHAKWNLENSVGAVDARQFQWDFWKEKVLEIQKENEKVFVFMNDRSAEYSPDTIEMCRKKILCFYKMAELYKDSIYKEILRETEHRSELTVLIGLDAIQKYRCSKYLRLWKIISWEHQRNATSGNRDPTRGSPRNDFYETEALITRNVGEFLNVIYDLRK